MQNCPFSINIDECTSSNSQKVFSILVSYFDVESGESFAYHYESISLIEVNAKCLLECICKFFIRDDLPFKNLVSDLSDSTNYMRWNKGRLGKLLWCKALRLLDIDSNFCHHIHNPINHFCKCFKASLKNELMAFIGTQSIVLIFWICWKRFALYRMYHSENLLR